MVLEEACNLISHALTLEGIEVLGELKVTGNPECMVCGFGESQQGKYTLT